MESLRYEYSVGSVARSRAWSTAADTARPQAPPALRKKFRFEMMTALRDLGECAWSATSVGWKMQPTPTPIRRRGMTMTPGLVRRLRIRATPAPLV